MIPCYNSAKTVERAVLSALHQSRPPAEVIIVDDHSDDLDTARLLQSLMERHPLDLHVVTLSKNGGPAAARNAGWDVATRKFVAFLDADDVWVPRKLEYQLPLMEGETAPVMSGHRIGVTRQPVGDSEVIPTVARQLISAKQLCFRNMLPTPSVIVRRDISLRFDAKRQFCEDYDLWLRIAFKYGEFGYFDATLAYAFKALYGESGLSQSLSRMEAGQTAIYRDLYRDGYFGLKMMITLISWAKIRYGRRIILSQIGSISRR
ncbi:glycosyltransferase [Cryobacterium sp. Hb1]|uniref:glycosyltransferase family 2 protein n=1 Tax=Cryobacterium sp. Hb1 TaxID=1259147 RepID=UPI0021029286|nr:glycosyltransferase [Cryobacterium sp. Hb1]